MQLTNMLSFLAIAMAINAAPAPNVEAAEGPYLKVRELVDSKSGVGDADYNYIKKSKVPELISRDANGVEESFLKVRTPGGGPKGDESSYRYIKV